ncbi:nucleotidyltransferase family protein [Aureisphaera galaxeae]|uniref:nucleotidyltransferase family protein n=1 Tax=Aureisphaera galaxeae TaxID=1538023 RepID=UPI00235028BF|nr:nucleotidyltransferase family protein [Aureisphaera galaxeae]MDC8006168.1 nucleotidyltransferase family protein [Aureisphaera galaxeae]
MSHTAIVVLAAGSSSRLGSPKQLLAYKNTSLIQHTLNQLDEIPSSQIFVVLGAYVKFVEREITTPGVITIFNPDWVEGMGNSLAKAIQEITKQPSFEHVLVTLCDLPLLEKNFYKSLLHFHQSGKNDITRTAYQHVKGVPVIFNTEFFPELQQLISDEGAKTVIQKHKNRVTDFSWPEPYFDIDTMESYQKLLLKTSE